MIEQRPYRNRTHGYLFKRLKHSMNQLQMRDWNVEFNYGDTPPA